MTNSYDWKEYSRGWPYTGGVSNKKYLKDRSELFAKSGNGWWWKWTHFNCPIEEMKPYLKDLYDRNKL
jgi:hypothetical protein|tara:strand:+ start:1071 stop:1274 length:204 start_codon:yes stop_codon:yes gene_type:complete